MQRTIAWATPTFPLGSCWTTRCRGTEGPRRCIQERAAIGCKKRFFARVGVPTWHERRSSQHCCGPRDAHHVADGTCIDARFWKLGTVSAPQSGFHVIANGRFRHDEEALLVGLAYVRYFGGQLGESPLAAAHRN